MPALQDNYMYVLYSKSTKHAAVVDPVEPAKLAPVIERLGLKVTHLLTTHSHWDHAGGNTEFVELFPSVEEVVGGKGDKAQAVTREVADGDTVQVGGLKVHVLFTPCHTPGHVCFYVSGSGGGSGSAAAAAAAGGNASAADADATAAAVTTVSDGGSDAAVAGSSAPHSDAVSTAAAAMETQVSAPGVVFTGDTMFVAGCGNFNAGTPAQMRAAFDKLKALPGDTLVCCGHEYTASNLAYARFVEPHNEAIAKKQEWVAVQRKALRPTVPSTLNDEAATNPFLRVRVVAQRRRVLHAQLGGLEVVGCWLLVVCG